MRSKRITSVVFFLFGLTLCELQAQEVIPSSGGNGIGSGGSVSYTVGQAFYTSNSSEKGTVEEGVQHAYIITIESGINNALYAGITCKAYPNPTNDYLTLNFENELESQFAIILYDINGRKLKEFNVREKITDIPMREYGEGLYLLKLYKENKLNSSIIKTFKILKK